jgi:hypothetical protein
LQVKVQTAETQEGDWVLAQIVGQKITNKNNYQAKKIRVVMPLLYLPYTKNFLKLSKWLQMLKEV